MAFTLRKAIATGTFSNFCRKFLGGSPMNLFNATRLSSSLSSETESQVKDERSSDSNPPGTVMENPFQFSGPKDVIVANQLKDGNGVLVRVTLPGVGEDGYRVWVEKNRVFFAGIGEIEREGEECGREYGGSLEFNPKLNKVNELKAEMKNGILRMIIPCVTNKS